MKNARYVAESIKNILPYRGGTTVQKSVHSVG